MTPKPEAPEPFDLEHEANRLESIVFDCGDIENKKHRDCEHWDHFMEFGRLCYEQGLKDGKK